MSYLTADPDYIPPVDEDPWQQEYLYYELVKETNGYPDEVLFKELLNV